MSDYIHQSDIQVALAALVAIQDIIIYIRLFRATTERSRRTIQRMRALLVLLYGSASQRHLATWHAYYIKFHTLLRHRVHADFHPKTLV